MWLSSLKKKKKPSFYDDHKKGRIWVHFEFLLDSCSRASLALFVPCILLGKEKNK